MTFLNFIPSQDFENTPTASFRKQTDTLNLVAKLYIMANNSMLSDQSKFKWKHLNDANYKHS